MKVKKIFPKIDLNVTNNCNFRCIHCCFTSGELQMDEFPSKEIEKILRLFKTLGGWRIDITGGEPLMRKDIDEIVKIAKQLELKTELVTNGALLTREKLQKYKKMGLDGVAISLDGSNHKMHHKIRGVTPEIFERIIQTISESVELEFYTKINTVVFNSNLDNLVEISNLAIQLGANEHGFYYFSPIGRGSQKRIEVANPISWLKIIRTDLIKLKDKIKFSVETPIIKSELTDKLNIKCFLKDPWHLQILPDGNVYPCAIMAAYKRMLSNLHKNTLKEIWENKKLWDGSYYTTEALPLFKEFGGCVNYPSFSHLIKSGKYSFVCLCRKFSLEELQNENK